MSSLHNLLEEKKIDFDLGIYPLSWQPCFRSNHLSKQTQTITLHRMAPENAERLFIFSPPSFLLWTNKLISSEQNERREAGERWRSQTRANEEIQRESKWEGTPFKLKCRKSLSHLVWLLITTFWWLWGGKESRAAEMKTWQIS